MICAGSVRLIERLQAEGVIPERSSSGAAAEGTVAHQIREECLSFGLEPHNYVGHVMSADGFTFTVDDEMASHLVPGIDWINEQPGDVVVEHQVELSRWMPGQFGTLDTAIIQRDRRHLIVNDLKFGAGVPVDAEGNRQLRIYALGVLDNFDLWEAVDEVLVVIDQPRAGGHKPWTVSVEDLRTFGDEVRAAALRIDEPDAPLVFSEKGCQWCPVKDTEAGCPAYTAAMHDLFEGALSELDDLDSEPEFVDPALITPARRWYIVKHSHLATAWLSKLYQDCLAAADAGEPDPGSKAAEGPPGDRYFTDKEAAETILVDALGPDAFQPPKLIGIPAAQKLLEPKKRKPGNPDAWAKLANLIDRPPGKTILVSEDDPRPAKPSLLAALDDLEDLV